MGPRELRGFCGSTLPHACDPFSSGRAPVFCCFQMSGRPSYLAARTSLSPAVRNASQSRQMLACLGRNRSETVNTATTKKSVHERNERKGENPARNGARTFREPPKPCGWKTALSCTLHRTGPGPGVPPGRGQPAEQRCDLSLQGRDGAGLGGPGGCRRRVRGGPDGGRRGAVLTQAGAVQVGRAPGAEPCQDGAGVCGGVWVCVGDGCVCAVSMPVLCSSEVTGFASEVGFFVCSGGLDVISPRVSHALWKL